MNLPIFGGISNREVIGYAASQRRAEAVVRRTIDVPKGFSLAVWRRDPRICEILEAPDGFVYSVSYRA